MTKPRGKQPPWTEDERATLRRMVAAGYADREIAAHLNRTRRQVLYQRQKLNIPTAFDCAARMFIARMAWTRAGRKGKYANSRKAA